VAPEPPQSPGVKAPIVIGNVGTWSGPLGSSTAESPRALRVWARWINDRGGINGHPVQVISADDGGDTGRHDALVQDMVENRKVIAFVDNWYFLNTGRAPAYLREKRIPVVGGELVNPVWFTEPLFFPQGGSADALIYGVARAAVTAGKAKVGITWCTEAVACRTAKDSFVAALKRLGGTIVYDSQISLAQPDFTAECLSLQRAGAQSVWVFADSNTLVRSARSCARQGYRPTYLAGLATQTDNLPGIPELDGLLGAVNLVPWFATTGTPGIEEYRDALTRYAADIRPGADVAIGWVAGKLFERAARLVGDIPTSADILRGLWQIQNDDLGGITVPLSFTQDRPAARPLCWVPTEIRNHRWMAPSNGRPICEPGSI
jgi:branched-chain amino acid transport system substrate-binding protein